jgi:uncharacterized protein GlcG (DUF336 family)
MKYYFFKTMVNPYIAKCSHFFFIWIRKTQTYMHSINKRVLNQISIMDGKMAAFQGGILVREKSTGEIVGSVGVSGAAGDEDEYCALYGVHNCELGLASQLDTVPSEHSCKTLAKM